VAFFDSMLCFRVKKYSTISLNLYLFCLLISLFSFTSIGSELSSELNMIFLIEKCKTIYLIKTIVPWVHVVMFTFNIII